MSGPPPRRTGEWKTALEALVLMVERSGIRSLGDEEVLQLNRLYRRLTAELARARRDDPRGLEADRLNAFASRVHGVIYTRRRTPIQTVGRFFTDTLPMTMARHLRVALLGIAVFLVGTAFSYAFVRTHPDKTHYIVPPQVIENAEQGFTRENFAPTEENWRRGWPERPLVVGFYVSNNVRVAVTAFAVGIAFAAPTILILFQNGIVMGSTVAIVERNGGLPWLLGWVSPHGAIELGAIFWSAAAGMLLGWALIRPGRRTRREALVRTARDVVVIVIGAALMLVVAAVLETFVAPLPVHPAFKYVIGAVNLALVVAYVVHGWRRLRAAPPGALDHRDDD